LPFHGVERTLVESVVVHHHRGQLTARPCGREAAVGIGDGVWIRTLVLVALAWLVLGLRTVAMRKPRCGPGVRHGHISDAAGVVLVKEVAGDGGLVLWPVR
jgi:hypothetical protein